MSGELTEKEKVLRMIIQSKKKRKVKKIQDPVLKVGGVESTIAADDILLSISYRGKPSSGVRQSLRNIIHDYIDGTD